MLGLLGAGGMGVVYSAYDPELDRKVALKLLHKSSTGDAASQRLQREAQAMARLAHPNVATVHDVGVHDDRVFVAMEYVAGTTLTAWLDAAERSVAEIAAVFAQAARGLAAAHDEGLVHRDFKPDNVMVGEDPQGVHAFGRVRVMDFGLARPTGEVELEGPEPEAHSSSRRSMLSTPVTHAGAVVGTPLYMAPEQWAGGVVDARGDQFAFCVALYQALFRQHPFMTDGPQSLLAAVTSGELRPVPMDVRVPRPLRAAVMRGLASDPADRWPSMQPLIALLELDPHRRVRSIGVAAACVGALVLGAGWWQVDRARAAAACDHAARAAEDDWNAAARERLSTAMLTSGLAYAQDSRDRVASVLDRWTEDWSAVRAEVCRDELGDHVRTTAQNEAASRCLESRRRDFRAYLDAIEKTGEVRGAIMAALDLPRPGACVDEAFLAERSDWPQDPDVEARVAALSERVAIGKQHLAVGDFPTGVRIGTQVAREAESIGWEPLIASAYMLLGRALNLDGKYPVARAALLRAFTGAVAAGRDGLAIEAAEELASVTGMGLESHVDGIAWIDIALAIETRSGAATANRGGDLWRMRGMLHAESGKLERAIEDIDRAVELDEEAFGVDHPFTAISVQTRCNVYDGLHRFDESLRCNQRALAIQREFLGPEHPLVAVALNNLAVQHARRGDLKEARRILEEALALRRRVLSAGHPDIAQSLANLGGILASDGDFPGALARFEEALEIQERAQGADSPATATTLANIATVHLELGRPLQAAEPLERAIEILERSLGPMHPQVAQALAGRASVLRALGRNEEAEAARRREIEILASVDSDPRGLAVARLNLGILLGEVGRFDEALVETRAARQGLEAHFGAEHPDVAAIDHAEAVIHAQRGELREALPLAQAALAKRERLLGAEHPDCGTTSLLVGKLELEIGDVKVAAATLEQAMTRLRGGEPTVLAEAELQAARAAWALGERGRARDLVEQARARIVELGPGHDEQRATLDAWLEEHAR